MPNILKNDWEAEFSYAELLNILLHRRFWFLTVFFGVLSMTLLATLISKATYQSQMQLLVEPNYSNKEVLDPEKNKNISSTSKQNVDYATQLNLMRSSQFVSRAVDLLKHQYPEMELEHIEENLSLSQLAEDDINTKIFQVEYTDHDPIKTQKVLLALQEVYQDYNLQQENSRLTEGLALLDRQLPSAKQSLNEAQGSLENFRSQEHSINPQQQAEAIAANLDSIQAERISVETEYQETQARYQSLQQQLNIAPEKALIYARLGESQSYQSLLAELQATELEIAEQRLTFSDTTVQVQKLLEKRQNLIALLDNKAKQILGENLAQKIRGDDFLTQAELGANEQGVIARLVQAHTELIALDARKKSLAQSQQDVQKQLDRFSSLIARYDNLKPEVDIQRDTIKQLLEKRQELSLELARGGYKWQIVEAPQLGKKIAPSPKKNILLGGVLGIFLGAIAVFIREVTDDTIHTTADLIDSVAFPLLGVTPQLPSAKLKNSPDKILLDPLGSNQSKSSLLKIGNFKNSLALKPSLVQIVNWLPYRESIDLIYQKIQLVSPFAIKSLLVTSLHGGEGKSTVVMSLALSAARLHKKVVVMDTNLRSPTLHQQLNLDNDYGLSTILSNPEISVRLKRLSLANSHIDILTAGPESTDPVNLLSSKRMKQLMEWLEENYDLVLLDASGLLGKKNPTTVFPQHQTQPTEFISTQIGTVDVLETAPLCSGVVLVTKIDEISKDELKEAESILSKFRVIGMVVNGGVTLKNKYDLDLE